MLGQFGPLLCPQHLSNGGGADERRRATPPPAPLSPSHGRGRSDKLLSPRPTRSHTEAVTRLDTEAVTRSCTEADTEA